MTQISAHRKENYSSFCSGFMLSFLSTMLRTQGQPQVNFLDIQLTSLSLLLIHFFCLNQCLRLAESCLLHAYYIPSCFLIGLLCILFLPSWEHRMIMTSQHFPKLLRSNMISRYWEGGCTLTCLGVFPFESGEELSFSGSDVNLLLYTALLNHKMKISPWHFPYTRIFSIHKNPITSSVTQFYRG